MYFMDRYIITIFIFIAFRVFVLFLYLYCMPVWSYFSTKCNASIFCAEIRKLPKHYSFLISAHYYIIPTLSFSKIWTRIKIYLVCTNDLCFPKYCRLTLNIELSACVFTNIKLNRQKSNDLCASECCVVRRNYIFVCANSGCLLAFLLVYAGSGYWRYRMGEFKSRTTGRSPRRSHKSRHLRDRSLH